MRPHSGSEQVPVRRRGFQPAGAQRRPPALPVQPLQRDEEADRGGRAAVLARDVQGGWAARLAASAPGAAACGGKTGRALAGRPRGRLLVSRVGSTAGQCWQRLSTESAQARPPPAPRALLPARVLPGGSCAPVRHCARRALVRLLCGTELWGAGVVPAPLRAPGPGPGRMRSERRRPVIAMPSVPGPASGCADVIPLRRRWLGRPGVSVRGHGEPRAPSARK